MSHEFTREAVMEFLPAQFSRIWWKCLLRNLIHSEIFNLTKYREVLVKDSLLIMHAGMLLWIWQVMGISNGFIFQIINSLVESWGYAWPALTVIFQPNKMSFPFIFPFYRLLCSLAISPCHSREDIIFQSVKPSIYQQQRDLPKWYW